MTNVKVLKVGNGYYHFKLGKLLKDRNITLNKLITDTDTDFKVVKRLINGDLVIIDIFVLARICNYLNCDIKDIIEYKKEKEDNV